MERTDICCRHRRMPGRAGWPKRSTVATTPHSLAIVPDAEQCLSYAVSGFRVARKMIADSSRSTAGSPFLNGMPR